MLCDTRQRPGVTEPGLGLLIVFLLVEEVPTVLFVVLFTHTHLLRHDALHIVVEEVCLFVFARVSAFCHLLTLLINQWLECDVLFLLLLVYLFVLPSDG